MMIQPPPPSVAQSIPANEVQPVGPPADQMLLRTLREILL
ncbi:hypothetical protein L195_g063244, partial [Trifolium pratense]